jgi:hypothetical protein
VAQDEADEAADPLPLSGYYSFDNDTFDLSRCRGALLFCMQITRIESYSLPSCE